MKKHPYQILLTNDDGITSPGLWDLATAVESLGELTIVAPREQQSLSGRSLPVGSDGKIKRESIPVGDHEHAAYSVGGSPAQMVIYALREIAKIPFDLVISGINFGENAGDSVTHSGTVGAALQAASFGIPAMAVSLQMPFEDFYSGKKQDFTIAAHFSRLFASFILEDKRFPDIDVIKIEVPHKATLSTPWRIVRQAKRRYFDPFIKREGTWEENSSIFYETCLPLEETIRGTDLHALFYEKVVAVTPLSLDLTSRVDLDALQSQAHGFFSDKSRSKK